jgi:hypothetical protein
MFYQVDRQMNNLIWITEAFFERKADATKYINCKIKEQREAEATHGGPPRREIEYRAQERQFSKLKDFKFKK